MNYDAAVAIILRVRNTALIEGFVNRVAKKPTGLPNRFHAKEPPMNRTSHWTSAWQQGLLEESGRQWMYDGTAREVAEAKGWKVLETHKTDDMVLVETAPGKLLAIGALPRAYGFWSVDIPAA